MRMSEPTKPSPEGSDWTRLLTDPDLVSHLPILLQTYRDVSPEHRTAALLEAMRKIKDAAIHKREQKHTGSAAEDASKPVQFEPPEPIAETPPFELFAQPMATDRRRFTRIHCNVAVEIHVEDVPEPVWGNLVNVGRGGCLVETARGVPANKALEIGLWVANGQVWVKGVVINGVATRVTPSFGVHVQFSRAELSQKEHLREFLKFVEGHAHQSRSEHSYLSKLKT